TSGVFGVGGDRPNVVRSAQAILGPADVEQLALAEDGVAAVADVLGRLIRGTEKAKRESVPGACDFRAPHGIHDMPCVDRNAHVAVATCARDVEQAETLHEE